jgi:hypothetical protein
MLVLLDLSLYFAIHTHTRRRTRTCPPPQPSSLARAVQSTRNPPPVPMMMRRGGAKGATGPPTVHLPKEIYALFDNPPVTFWKTAKKKKVRVPFQGVAQVLKQVAPPTALPGQIVNPHATEPLIPSAYVLKQDRKRKREAERMVKLQKRLALWDPHAPNEAKTHDGYKTLFAGRLSASTDEKSLAAAMEPFGHVVTAKVVRDKAGASMRYGFVEFGSDDALQRAFKGADAMALDGATIVVDVERARTVGSWVPQRFGGGLGGPIRQKGYTLKSGRGGPEPPKRRGWRR